MGRFPKGWCSACHHLLRHEIDIRLLNGETLATVAEEYHISEAVLSVHRAEHLTQELAEAAEEEQAEAKERGEDLWSQLKELRKKAWAILDKVESSDKPTALKAIRELSRLLEIQAKIEGKIKANEITINQMNIYSSPEWIIVGRSLAEALQPYPEAREKVAACLLSLAEESKACP
jgi:predicted transcriptional regulator